jgi:hypothetical protein
LSIRAKPEKLIVISSQLLSNWDASPALWFVPMDAAAASFTAVRRVEFDFQFDTHTKQFPAESI